MHNVVSPVPCGQEKKSAIIANLISPEMNAQILPFEHSLHAGLQDFQESGMAGVSDIPMRV